MNSINLGAVTVTRLVEWTGPVLTVDAFFPDVAATTWTDNQDWLAPDFWRPTDGAYPVALQSWLLRSAGRNILIDTGGGNGNGKSRPSNPAFDQLDTRRPPPPVAPRLPPRRRRRPGGPGAPWSGTATTRSTPGARTCRCPLASMFHRAAAEGPRAGVAASWG